MKMHQQSQEKGFALKFESSLFPVKEPVSLELDDVLDQQAPR